MSWFRSNRKVATESAIAAMRPLIALTQLSGGMSLEMWNDPYLLGYLSFVSSFFAKQETGGKIQPEELGLSLMDAYSTVSNMSGSSIARVSLTLQHTKDPDFEKGVNDSITVTLYSIDVLKDEETNPLVLKCRPMAEAFSGMMPGGDFRSAVAGAMMHETFAKRALEIRGGLDA